MCPFQSSFPSSTPTVLAGLHAYFAQRAAAAFFIDDNYRTDSEKAFHLESLPRFISSRS